MDLQTLQKILQTAYNSDTKTFNCNNASLEDPNLSILLSYFPNQSLQGTNISQFNLTPQGAQVSGECSLQINPSIITTPTSSSISVQVQFTYTLSGNTLDTQIVFSNFPTSFNLSQVFADLTDPFSLFTLESTTITLDTNSINSGEIPFEISASLSNYEIIQPLKFLNGITSTVVNGSINVQSKLPIADLMIAFGPNGSLGFLQNVTIQINLASELVALSDIQNALWQGMLLQIVFSPVIDGNQIDIQVEMPLYMDFNGLLSLEVDITGISLSSLDALSQLVNDSVLSSILPTCFIPANLSLNNVSFVISPAAKSPSNILTSINVDVGVNQNWTIFDSIQIAIDTLSFIVTNPTDNQDKVIFCTMIGSFSIQNANFLVTASDPDFSFEAKLNSGTINLSDLVNFLIGSDSNLPTVAINSLDMNMDFDPSSKDWGFNVGLADLTFTVASQTFTLSSFRGYIDSQSGEMTGGFSGKIQIGGLGFSVGADYSGQAGFDFQGSTGQITPLPIGQFIETITDTFGNINIPASVSGLNLLAANIDFNTSTNDFTFYCNLQLPIDSQNLDLVFNISLTNNQGYYTTDFSGQLLLGNLIFNVIFFEDPAQTSFIASYSNSTANSISVQNLLSLVSISLAEDIPSDLTVGLKDSLFIFTNSGVNSSALVGLDLTGFIDLSNLPIIGQELPSGEQLGINDLQFLFLTTNLTSLQISSLNSIIPEGVNQLPSPTGGLTSGFSLGGNISLGSDTQSFFLQSNSSSDTKLSSYSDTNPPGKWFDVQRSFGPVSFQKVGINWQDGDIEFLLDASLSLSGLSLGLDGLGFGIDVNDPENISFELSGISVSYSNPSLSINGGLIKTVSSDQTVYNGELIVQSSEFSLQAVGSYATLNGQPCLFVFLLSNEPPLGGPPLFFITGVAAGLGYNRNLIIPSIEGLPSFPLIQGALGGPNNPFSSEDPSQALPILSQWIPVSYGNSWLAGGVAFTSFGLLQSFVLMSASLGAEFEINLVGISTLSLPPDASTPIVYVELSLESQFIPSNGVFSILAQITSRSYLFSTDCHLTGGFAFMIWFSPSPYQGDFVVTLGGYNPNFNPPSYYPSVPQLAFNWQLDDNISIQGGMYCALTPSCIMAGGYLEAVWQCGGISAWFDAYADFLIAWKPFHYDISIGVSIGVSLTVHIIFTIHISISVGADLHLWGPDFSGTAHIHLWVVSFSISFGAGSSEYPPPIPWLEFKTSFLPQGTEPNTFSVCNITPAQGLIFDLTNSSDNPNNINAIINAEQMVFITKSLIPSKTANVNGTAITPPQEGTQWNLSFGVGLVQVANEDFQSTHSITISQNGQPIQDFLQRFSITPIYNNVPQSLWISSDLANFNAESTIKNTLSGFQIAPIPFQPEILGPIPVENLLFTTNPINRAFTWSYPTVSTTDPFDQTQAMNTMMSSINDPNIGNIRSKIFQSILNNGAVIDTSTNLSDFTLNAYNWVLQAPTLSYLGEEKNGTNT